MNCVYYCEGCHDFVQENHKCEQQSTVYMIPQEAVDKLLFIKSDEIENLRNEISRFYYGTDYDDGL